MPNSPVPGKPIEKEQTEVRKETSSEEALLEFLRTRTFAFYYRHRYKPTCAYILAPNLTEAVKRAEQYCERFELRFISIHPFFLDLNKRPPDKTGNQ